MAATLQLLECFTRVAEEKSFSRAARLLGISKGTVSKAVTALEAELGAKLLLRSSRRVAPTEAGVVLAASGRAVLDEAMRGERRVRELRDTPAGTVRVNTATGVAAYWLAPALGSFLDAHPRVRVVLDATDERVDVLGGGYDVVVRVGRLADSGLRARRLGTVGLVCLASPAYLAGRGSPRHPADLAAHDCVTAGQSARPDRWAFARRSERRTVTVRGRLETNTDVVARLALLAGAGVGLLPTFMAEDDLAAGRLVALLPGWELTAAPVHALLPGGEPPAKTRAFVDWLAGEVMARR